MKPSHRAAVIFDLDDTLIESFPGYVALHQLLATKLGWRVPSEDELVAYGPTWPDTLARLWPDQSLAPFFELYETHADEIVYPSVPGAPQVVEQLKGRGHSLWIVTKRSRTRMHQRMELAGLDPALFDGIFALEDQAYPKPDPRCFEPVWRAIGARPAQAVYVGDRGEDRIAAQAAGVAFVGVLTGPEARHRHFDEQDNIAVLSDIRELPAYLSAKWPST